MTRTQNVDPINLDGIDDADRPSHFRIGDQIRINILAQFRRELFGIIQPAMTEFFRKNDSSGDNRTCQRAASSFINPSDPRYASGVQFLLVTKSASPVHPRKSLADLCE